MAFIKFILVSLFRFFHREVGFASSVKGKWGNKGLESASITTLTASRKN